MSEFGNTFRYYYTSEPVVDFIHQLNHISRGRLGLSVGFGVNLINNNVVSFKLYAETDKDFTADEVIKFLPKSVPYLKYSQYRSKTRSSAQCFGVKLTPNLKLTQYAHIKFDEKFRYMHDLRNYLVPIPGIPNINPLEFPTGASLEYCDKFQIPRKYYYFTVKDKRIGYIRECLGLTVDQLDGIDHIEYTVNSITGETKYILIGDSFESEAVYREYRHIPFVENVKTELQLLPCFTGKYLNSQNTISIYWSLTPVKLQVPYLNIV